ncbi:phenazine antibiotic biosynthesis protein [Kitasatospora phosalacinea]|uniref:Phenazine antibiotic biosynthesis protein n=1 Tax=Kitasatospora phosalacinea TaxID=2065 RepID=A0A9W6QBQ0_9ACTN|nr:phenazine biosynthesis protein [Kitasatospora phosalacinea]GLW73259.1 phenazine antibiotic biosynthesis protein [Kitasatospora phosalacinea]
MPDTTVPFDPALPAEEFLRAAMRWHFSPETGSPFWLKRAAELDFDPLTDINGWDDLDRFPDVSEEWRDVPVDALVPAGTGRDAWDFQVFDSGGTTGRPKRIVESTSRRNGVRWVSDVLTEHGIPGEGEGHWLHVGPTGPHIVGRSVGLLAQLRSTFCHYIDFDPRWVKGSVKAGRAEEAARYVAHILAQARDVLATQPVSVLFATPPVLEAIAADEHLLSLVQQKVRGIVWAGTSIGPETLRAFEEEIFPDAVVVGLYGNTMMGIAPQRPRTGEPDDERCVFVPYHPFSRVRVVDPEDTRTEVGYGERGQARISLVSRDLFLPWTLERDSVLRIAPTAGYPQDGLADVRPLTAPGGAQSVVEGVY